MITSFNTNNKMVMTSEMKNESIFQVLEFDDLKGSGDFNLSIQIDYMKRSSVKLRQIRLILEDSAIKIEAGSISYMKGNIEIEAETTEGIKGFGKRFFFSKATKEPMFKSIIKGTGEVFLEASFDYFTLIELQDEEIIVDDGLFYACEEGVEIENTMQKDEGKPQIKLSGSGIVVLKIPVPEKEILRCKIFRDTLKLDGDFAILRSANIDFTMEKPGTAFNGEGFLNIYRGTGEIWLTPTKIVYDKLKEKGIKESKAMDLDYEEEGE